MHEPRSASPVPQREGPPSLALRLEPYRLMAIALADFQADLAAADGPSHAPNGADPRLGALVMRSAARLVELYGEAQDPSLQAPLQELTAWLTRGCAQALTPPLAAATPPD